MKIKTTYKLREIAGETLVVNQGMTGTDMTRIISLNASARMLYSELQGKEFALEDAARLLVDILYKPLWKRIWDSIVIHIRRPDTIFQTTP